MSTSVKGKIGLGIIGMILFAVAAAFGIAAGGEAVGAVILLLPFIVFFVIASFNKPVILLSTMFVLGFILFPIDRYLLKGVFPIGILVDVLILYIYILLFFKSYSGAVEWKKAGEAPLFALFGWLLYCILCFFNPEAPAINHWIIGARPFLYMIFTIPLFCMLLDVKTIKWLIVCWGVFSILYTLKGIIQLKVGLDPVERIMMSGSMRKTHMLWGQLRVFSLCSDAGQFGVFQAHTGIVGAILLAGAKTSKERILYFLMMVTGIYGMFISGTRGAMFVLFAGGLVYFVLIKKIKLLLTGLILGGSFYVVMRYTTIGESSYDVRRMRTAFNPSKDPSYQVRERKDRQLKEYLASRPFGGGLGSMEDQGGPKNTFLGNLRSDGGYRLIWAQQGVVGLSLFIAMIAYFLIKGSYLVWFKIKNEWLRSITIAMIAGIAGVAVAQYGNPVFNQHPTAMIIYFGIAVIFIAPRIDQELTLDTETKDDK